MYNKQIIDLICRMAADDKLYSSYIENKTL